MSKVVFNSQARATEREKRRAEREAKMRYCVELGNYSWPDEYCTNSLLWARVYGKFWSVVDMVPYRIIDRQAK